jgi:hypothetical protein
MNSLTEGVITIALMIGGIALASVLVSRNANTGGVIQPVTGNAPSINLGYPAEASSFGT